MVVTKDKYETINKKFSKLNLPFMCYDIVMKSILDLFGKVFVEI